MVFSLVDIDQTTTITDTYLTTTVYAMVGVPEPSSVWLLGLGGIARAVSLASGASRLSRWTKSH